MPTGDTDGEILDALTKNGYEVTNVHRFMMETGSVKSTSFTALEFKDNCLKEILLSGLVFFPEKQLPFPLRGKNCQKLGHTERFCWTPRACSICGKGQQSTEILPFHYIAWISTVAIGYTLPRAQNIFKCAELPVPPRKRCYNPWSPQQAIQRRYQNELDPYSRSWNRNTQTSDMPFKLKWNLYALKLTK